MKRKQHTSEENQNQHGEINSQSAAGAVINENWRAVDTSSAIQAPLVSEKIQNTSEQQFLPPAIALRGLEKDFGEFKLSNITTNIPFGRITGLIGENGAGKSTLINCILGLIKPTAGMIFVEGQPVSQKCDIQAYDDIGIVIDEVCFPSIFTVNDVEKYVGQMYTRWDSKRFAEFMEEFKLPRKKIVKGFSKGMKMKLNLAVALCHDAHILILDEATSGLDLVARNLSLDKLKQYNANGDRAILISSHITSDLEKICDDVMFMNHGNLVFYDSLDNLRHTYSLVQYTDSLDKSQIRGRFKDSQKDVALIPFDKEIGPASLEEIILCLTFYENY